MTLSKAKPRAVGLGGGTPLFKQGERVKLTLLDSNAHSTGILVLRYEPAK